MVYVALDYYWISTFLFTMFFSDNSSILLHHAWCIRQKEIFTKTLIYTSVFSSCGEKNWSHYLPKQAIHICWHKGPLISYLMRQSLWVWNTSGLKYFKLFQSHWWWFTVNNICNPTPSDISDDLDVDHRYNWQLAPLMVIMIMIMMTISKSNYDNLHLWKDKCHIVSKSNHPHLDGSHWRWATLELSF